MQIKIKNTSNKIFPDGPPCLNQLAEQGFGEGSRNNALFNLAIYRQKANPDTWQDELQSDNQKYMVPPLGFQEVQNTIKSIGKKGYDKYRCDQAPINAVCNPKACSKCKFGVGFGEEQMPELGQLTKVTSSPPQWFLNVDGNRIELKTEQLHNPNLFAIAVLDQVNIVTPILKGKDWRETYLKALMVNLNTTSPLASLNPEEFLVSLLRDFTVNRPQARTKDDILRKMAWTDEGHAYFRMDDFYAWMKRNNWELDRIKTGNLLKGLEDIFVDEVRKEIKNQNPRLVKIKEMKKTDVTISKVKYEETPF